MVKEKLIQTLNSENKHISFELLMELFIDAERPIEADYLDFIIRFPKIVRNIINYFVEYHSLNKVLDKDGNILKYF